MGTRDAVGRQVGGVERRLLEKVSAGDRDARRRLIEGHLGMVDALARRYAGKWRVSREDLVQEGALALVRAVDHYDGGRGMKFSTYATWWVKGAIRRAAMAGSRPVRIPEGLWARAGEMEASRGALRPAIPLETRVGDGTHELGEILPDPDAEDPAETCARNDARRRLAEALASLPERERLVLSGRAGLDGQPRSLAAIGRGLGVSRERARQLEGAGLETLRGRRRELGLEGLVA